MLLLINVMLLIDTGRLLEENGKVRNITEVSTSFAFYVFCILFIWAFSYGQAKAIQIRYLGRRNGSLRASSPIWASETSLARTREARFACPNRRACSQASHDVYLCRDFFFFNWHKSSTVYDIIFPWTPKADHRRPQVQGSVTIATGRTFLHEQGFLVCQFAEISVPVR